MNVNPVRIPSSGPGGFVPFALGFAAAAAITLLAACSQNEYSVSGAVPPAPANPRNAHLVKKGEAGMNNAAATQEEMPAQPADEGAAPEANVFSGTVTLPAALSKKFKPGETLYVILRDNGGTPAPLAALKLSVTSFPLSFQLTDQNAMMGGALPASGQIILRLDKDGDLSTQDPDDLVGGPAPAKAGQPVTLALEVPKR